MKSKLLSGCLSARLARAAACTLLIAHVLNAFADLDGRLYAVELTAAGTAQPPEIRLLWPGDEYARSYAINRKRKEETIWVPIGTADGPSTGFSDTNVQAGEAYEYQVIKDSSYNIVAYGYIYSGINVPLVENRGIIIILSEAELAAAVKPELDRLEYDLIGDGWSVARATVAKTNTPPEAKSIIKEIYDRDPAHTRAL